jgi:hypothetical protein
MGAGGGQGAPSPLPEEPTEELPVVPGAAPWDMPLLRAARADQEHFRRLARAVLSHRMAARSGAVSITPADHRLYAALDRLEQPN